MLKRICFARSLAGQRQQDTEPQLVAPQEYVVGSKVTFNFGDRDQATDQKQPPMIRIPTVGQMTITHMNVLTVAHMKAQLI